MEKGISAGKNHLVGNQKKQREMVYPKETLGGSLGIVSSVSNHVCIFHAP